MPLRPWNSSAGPAPGRESQRVLVLVVGTVHGCSARACGTAVIHRVARRRVRIRRVMVRTGSCPPLQIAPLRPGGGTLISQALETATTMFKNMENEASNRVMLVTDMETHGDQDLVLQQISQNARKQLWTSVLGVDVDLSVALVEKISRVHGARYLSAASATEFKKLMDEEFDYDVMPVAFDIRLDVVAGDVAFTKAFGSPELNDVFKAGESKTAVQLSCEFPNPVDGDGGIKGNMLLFRLAVGREAVAKTSPVKLRMEYQNAQV